MIPKSPHNIRIAFGMTLEAAGLARALQNVDDLLDDGYQETFIEYFPKSSDFESFAERFAISRFELMQKLQWTYDKPLLKRNPVDTQIIKEYFLETFKPAVLNPEKEE